jgi:hypothetical protein
MHAGSQACKHPCCTRPLLLSCFCALQLQVIKWSKNLPGLRAAFQREWMLGRRLNAAARQDPALNLLLQTGAVTLRCCMRLSTHPFQHACMHMPGAAVVVAAVDSSGDVGTLLVIGVCGAATTGWLSQC